MLHKTAHTHIAHGNRSCFLAQLVAVVFALHRDCGEYVLIVNLIEVGLVCLAANKVARNARDTTKNAYLICLMVANSAICGWLATAAFCMHHECINDGQNTRLGTHVCVCDTDTSKIEYPEYPANQQGRILPLLGNPIEILRRISLQWRRRELKKQNKSPFHVTNLSREYSRPDACLVSLLHSRERFAGRWCASIEVYLEF